VPPPLEAKFLDRFNSTSPADRFTPKRLFLRISLDSPALDSVDVGPDKIVDSLCKLVAATQVRITGTERSDRLLA